MSGNHQLCGYAIAGATSRRRPAAVGHSSNSATARRLALPPGLLARAVPALGRRRRRGAVPLMSRELQAVVAQGSALHPRGHIPEFESGRRASLDQRVDQCPWLSRISAEGKPLFSQAFAYEHGDRLVGHFDEFGTRLLQGSPAIIVSLMPIPAFRKVTPQSAVSIW
jgi:hypothetical protein